MDKTFDWIFKHFGKLWLVAFVVGIAFWGVVIWGIVELVLHFT